MEVISGGRMSNQSWRAASVWERKQEGERGSVIHTHRERERNAERKDEIKWTKMILNYPSSLAKPAGQSNTHSVHLRSLRASRTSKTFTKYPLTTHSLLSAAPSLPRTLFLLYRLRLRLTICPRPLNGGRGLSLTRLTQRASTRTVSPSLPLLPGDSDYVTSCFGSTRADTLAL